MLEAAACKHAESPACQQSCKGTCLAMTLPSTHCLRDQQDGGHQGVPSVRQCQGGDSPKQGPMRDVQGNKQTSGRVQVPSETQRPELLSAYQLCVQKGLGG